MLIKIKDINITGGTQPRENIDMAIVAEYADAMEEGAKFPPVVVFDDGAVKWLADGFHRVHATSRVGYEDIDAEIIQGTVRDALWYSLGANKDHGLHRSPGDKRKAIETALKDPEWSKKYNQNDIAKHIGVTAPYVAKVKLSINQLIDDPGKRTVTRNGVTYEQNTANIGRKRKEDLRDSSVYKAGLVEPVIIGQRKGGSSVVCEPNMPITDGDEDDDADIVDVAPKGGTVSAAYVYAEAAIAQLSKIKKWDKEGIKELKRVGSYIEKKTGELSKSKRKNPKTGIDEHEGMARKELNEIVATWPTDNRSALKKLLREHLNYV